MQIERAQRLGIELTTHPVLPFANRSQRRVEVNTGKHGLCCQVTPSPFSAICLHLLMQQGIKKKRCSSYIIQNGPTAPLNESQAKKNTTTIFFFFFFFFNTRSGI